MAGFSQLQGHPERIVSFDSLVLRLWHSRGHGWSRYRADWSDVFLAWKSGEGRRGAQNLQFNLQSAI
jgi:hypothetical protein